MNCDSCQYFGDFTRLGMGLRCMNTANSPIPGDFKILQNSNGTCGYYKVYVQSNCFEWDPNKNNSNKKKHGISFERIYDLHSDPFMLQMVVQPEKWEDVNNLPDHVERNEGNTDPLRAKLIGSIGGNIYTAVYTFRGGVGEMKYRIISLRRADKNDCKSYEAFKSLKS